MEQTMRAATLALALLSVSACSAGNKGLDRALDMRDMHALGVSCGKAFSEMRSANTKEYVGLKDMGIPVFDLTQPRDQALFGQVAAELCLALGKDVGKAAEQDNLALKTVREIWSWGREKSINEAAAHYERYMAQYRDGGTGFPCGSGRSPTQKTLCVQRLHDLVESIRRDQQILEILTGKTHGPRNLQVPE